MTIKILASNAAWSTASHLLGRGSLVCASIILANRINIDSFAAYASFQLTTSMLGAYAAMGLGVTASSMYAEARESNNLVAIRYLWIASLVIALVISTAVLLVPGSWLTGGLNIPKWLLFVGVLSVAIGVVPAGGVLGLEKYAESTVVAAASAILLVGGCFASPQGGDATYPMVLFSLAAITTAIGNTIIVRRSTKAIKRIDQPKFTINGLKPILSFAGPMLIVGLISTSGTWLVGRIILEQPEGQKEFSLFSIGLQWYGLALFLPGMVSRVLLPPLIRARNNRNSDDAIQKSKILVKNGVFLTLAIATTIAIIGSLASPWLLDLYGSNFGITTALLALFLFAAIPAAPANTVGNALIANKGQNTWLALTSFWFFSLTIFVLLLRNFGAQGGAIALALASSVFTFLAYVAAKRKRVI